MKTTIALLIAMILCSSYATNPPVIIVEFMDATVLPSLEEGLMGDGYSAEKEKSMISSGLYDEWMTKFSDNNPTYLAGDRKKNISVVIKQNGQVIRSTANQIRKNTEKDIDNLATEVNNLYPELWTQESLIEGKKDEVEGYLANPAKDKSHLPCLDELVDMKKKKKEIETKITEKTNEMIGTDGSGPLGWYYIN